ncbi:MAG TPA: hypothetical protein VHO70_10505, partial [Chitinispirillaceae bacterium]|nr:hypothetical protein [Chitinispirillaceae bacterium]
MKRTIYLVLVLFSASANEIITRSSTVQLLDCVNFREYTLSGLSDLKSLMYRPLTFTTDTMESNIEKDTTSFRPQLSVLADLSSETGEPLFLRVTGGDSRNREHGTFGRVTLTVPKIHTQISGSYRHLGMYADRTEDFCTSYEQHRGSALPHRDMGHYGVAEYIIGKISSEIRRVSSKTTINRYGEWMVIPGLYNPLYKKGNAVSQSLKIPFNRNLLSLNGMADQRVLYTGHNSTVKKMYYDVQASYNRELFSSDSLSVNLHLSNEKNYGDHFGVQFSHFAAIYNLSVTAGIWSAGMPDANVRFAVPFLDSSDVSLGYSFVYIPEEASIPQTTPLNVVTTRIDPLHYNQVRLSTNVRHCFRTPLSIELWTDYKSAYQTYSVDSTRDT